MHRSIRRAACALAITWLGACATTTCPERPAALLPDLTLEVDQARIWDRRAEAEQQQEMTSGDARLTVWAHWDVRALACLGGAP